MGKVGKFLRLMGHESLSLQVGDLAGVTLE